MTPRAEHHLEGPGRAGAFRRAYADAILRGDGDAAEQIVADAIAASLDEATIHDAVIAPALRLVGDLWADGEIGIADEHLATEISLRVLALQREAFRLARRRAGHRILLATVRGERHDVGLRMAASLLLGGGFDVRMLGPDVPEQDLADAVDRHRPGIVGLSATMAGPAARLPAAISAVRASAPGAGIVVGGAATRGFMSGVPDVVVCRHVSDATGLIEGLLQRAHHN